jgi:hypothetical protein
MIRYFLAEGDRAQSAVIIEGLESVTCSNPPPLVHIATLYMKTYCTACKRRGFIAPKGPRWPGTGPNGEQWALSGDINVCGCNPPPIFYAERGMSMIFTSEQVARLTSAMGTANQRDSVGENADNDLECYYEIVEAKSGKPVEGMTYALSSNGRVLVDNAPLTDGRTRSFAMKDHPRLTIVAWREGDVR